jgi:hypothetical protein
MAYTFGFGGSSTNRTSYVYGTNHGVKSEYGGFPVGNINDAGWRPVKIYSISVHGLSGGYANIWFGGANSGPGGVWNSSGGMFAIRCISTSSPMYFGRLNDNGVNTIDEADGSVWSPRGGLVGSFTWATVPPAPTFNSATPGSSGGTVNIQFTSTGDGGEGVDQWQVQYATNSGFTTGTGTFNSSGTSTFTGTPGVTYWFRARGRNDVGWGQWSGSKSATTVGAPSATRNLAATVSTTLPNAINLTWDAPTTPGGTITGYKIYRGGTLVHTTSGTGETYTDSTGLTRGTSYSYVVRARNSWSDSNSTEGAASNTATATAQGVPSAPLNLTAVAHSTIPGRIDLDWDAPTYAGVGGLTGYQVYLSTGALVEGNIAAGTTSYSATGLSPGVQYGFIIRAKNAVSTTSGVLGDPSTTVYSSALGDPPQVTGLTVTPDAKVAGRLKLQWTSPVLGDTAVTGYTVFDASTGAEIARTASQTYMIDGLSPGTSYSYYVKARNTVTDVANTDGGPQSVTVSGSPSATSNQPTGSISGALNNNTNTTLNGNKVISSTTATTFTYIQSGSAVAQVNSGGTTANVTNTALNGTYTVTVTGAASLTYSKTTPNLSATATGGLLTNNTNNEFNGTFTLTAADSFDKTLSYALPGADLAEVAVTGIVTNNTNANFNGTGFEILSITSNTFTYARTSADVAEISAAGTVTNTTNRDYYNGTYEVLDVPSYNVFRYSRV